MDAPLGAKFKTTTDMYKAWVQPLHQVRYWSSEVVKSYWADNTLASKEWFDLDLWTCDLKINSDHLLIKCNPCTKFGIDQVKGSKYIERTTDWARKSGLTLTFEHVTWKSIKDHLHIEVNPCIDQVKGQKISSGQHLVDRPIDTQLQNNMPPFSRGGGGIKIWKNCVPRHLIDF